MVGGVNMCQAQIYIKNIKKIEVLTPPLGGGVQISLVGWRIPQIWKCKKVMHQLCDIQIKLLKNIVCM